MEEKERFMNTIESVNNDNTIMQEWILEENARLKYQGEMSYAREEGKEEGIKEGKEEGRKGKELELIKNMLNKGLDYSIIFDITGKTVEEIKEIESTIE